MTRVASTAFADSVLLNYLYGSAIIPADLTSETLIRHEFADGASMSVSAQEYMAGPGRFAKISLSNLVVKFFNLHPSDVPQHGEGPLIFTKAQFVSFLKTIGYGNSFPANFAQSSYDDGLDDYALRSFIWETSEFAISEECPTARLNAETGRG